MDSRTEVIEKLSVALKAAESADNKPSQQILDELNTGLCNFFLSVPHDKWKKYELKLIKAVTRFDPRCTDREFLSNLSEEDLANLIIVPFVDDGIRMYLMFKTYLIEDKGRRKEIALRFFENDSSESIRAEALIFLAKLKWSEALKHAKVLWKTEDTVNRLVALKVFETLKGKDLQRYLAEATESSDKSVRVYAKALRSTIDL